MSAQENVDPDEIFLQIDEVGRVELAEKLEDLSDQLRRAADLMYNSKQDDELRERYAHGAEPDQYEQLAIDAKYSDDFRRALTTLRDFRRQYNRWERVIAEFALGKMAYSQRDAAKHLGVGVSTINRWAQHPLTVDEPR
jgi:hypothetical protein